MKKINSITHPYIFQGKDKNRSYFEGWYYKHTVNGGETNFSIIPGINYTKGKRQAFIQVIIGPKYKSYYIDYPFEEFSYTDEPFMIKIADSKFTLDYIKLDIESKDISLQGKIAYNNLSKIDTSFFQPNIMGFFAYFGFMQCNHGIISLKHDLHGEITYNDKIINFDNGKGYIEKDWGTSFPRKYCWIQCNHFDEYDNSFFFSIAHIPFVGLEFMGFISILKLGEKQYRFATYNGSKVIKKSFKNDKVEIEVKKRRYTLKIQSTIKGGRVLKAPKEGIMADDIKETLEGVTSIELYHKGKLIYSGTSLNSGVEVVDMD